ncbi:hypothetical protein HELRODRAFT_162887 [Helobdella robusta]|uniref:Uncharacterized protein n=1 Tax=Helobdella robusta TaxID=6412 RepID=T1ETB6_HELRO|nr:hypothetical protein HELRODRAFT_162887 [Helobdella robusta]ESN99354.1 hypothetical protein HELRODRAFT_162887 [Helobdella robusta]
MPVFRARMTLLLKLSIRGHKAKLIPLVTTLPIPCLPFTLVQSYSALLPAKKKSPIPWETLKCQRMTISRKYATVEGCCGKSGVLSLKSRLGTLNTGSLTGRDMLERRRVDICSLEDFNVCLQLVGPMANNLEQLYGLYSPAIDARYGKTPFEGLNGTVEKTILASGCNDNACKIYNAFEVKNATVDADLLIVCLGTGPHTFLLNYTNAKTANLLFKIRCNPKPMSQMNVYHVI